MSSEQPAEFEGTLDGFPTENRGHEARTRIPLEVLATRFADELREGQDPSVDDYAQRFPMYAEEIRDLFPTVAAMERWKADKEAANLHHQVPESFSIERLGEYKIVREMGRGGMGVVFEGRRERSNQRVAIKLLPWRGSDVPRFRKRFEREAQTVATLNHKNIVPIYEFGESEGYSYFVMSFVQGVGLDWIIERLRDRDGVVYADEVAKVHGDDLVSSGTRRGLGRQSWKRMARIGIQAAQALEYAHGKKLLHNDIKPGNLLLDAKGHVWITDFGVAKSMDEAVESVDDRLTGTLRFMAPERFENRTDPRSDVYSLGVTLYELLSQKPAFQNEDRLELVDSIVEARVVPLKEIANTIPLPLVQIVERMMAADPARRYASAADVAEDLLRFQRGERPLAGRKRFLDRWRRK